MNAQRARELAESFSKFRVAVIGDLILDRYTWGTAKRISPEAPVPVVHVRKQRAVLGGAANVMRNLSSLGARVEAFGIVGDDDSATEMRSLLKSWNIGTDGVLAVKERQTTVKTRIIADNQQVVRIDDESCHDLATDAAESLLEGIRAAMADGGLDAVVLEDYNKGVLTPDLAQSIAKLARDNGAVCLLDPHPANPLNVQGLTLMTPNRAESFSLAGAYLYDPVVPLEDDEALQGVADRLLETWQPANLLITLGAGGMALYRAGEPVHHIPTVAREVFDVSGAGDTVIAACTLAMLAGASSEEAAELANHAGGIVVGKIGTVCVETEELLGSFERSDDE